MFIELYLNQNLSLAVVFLFHTFTGFTIMSHSYDWDQIRNRSELLF